MRVRIELRELAVHASGASSEGKVALGLGNHRAPSLRIRSTTLPRASFRVSCRTPNVTRLANHGWTARAAVPHCAAGIHVVYAASRGAVEQDRSGTSDRAISRCCKLRRARHTGAGRHRLRAAPVPPSPEPPPAPAE